MSLRIVGSEGTLVADLINEAAQIHDARNPEGRRLDAPANVDGNEIYLRQFDFFFARCFPDYQTIFPETRGFEDWVSVEQAAEVLRLVDSSREANREGRRRPLSGQE